MKPGAAMVAESCQQLALSLGELRLALGRAIPDETDRAAALAAVDEMRRLATQIGIDIENGGT